MTRLICLIACAFTLLLSLAQGQNSAKESPQVKFRITRFDPEDKAAPKYSAGVAGDRITFEVPLNYIDGPHTARLRDGKFLDFFTDEGEKPEFSLPIAEQERQDLLLFFVRDGKSYRVLKIQTPLTAIGGGDRYLLNGTPSRLAIKLDKQEPLFIDPGKSSIVRGPGGKEIVSVPVLISLQENQEWKLASTENWYIDPRSRSYLLAHISPRTQQLGFYVITERL